MIDYQTFCRLRQLRDREGLSLAQIARELGLHPQTVALWANRAVYGQRKATPRSSKLDPFKATVSLETAVEVQAPPQLRAGWPIGAVGK